VNTSRAFERRKWDRRERRALHVGRTVFGTKERPRLSVYRSHRHFHCQIIDDSEGRTLVAASTVMKDLKGQIKNGGDKKAAAAVGAKLAEAAKAKGITKVVFDRNFYRFHGRVRAFAEAAAKGGLEFLLNPKKKDKPVKERKEKASKAEPKAKEKKPKPEGAAGGKPGADKPQGQKPGPAGKPPADASKSEPKKE
jgi:large subunit ribosomal protein L18